MIGKGRRHRRPGQYPLPQSRSKFISDAGGGRNRDEYIPSLHRRQDQPKTERRREDPMLKSRPSPAALPESLRSTAASVAARASPPESSRPPGPGDAVRAGSDPPGSTPANRRNTDRPGVATFTLRKPAAHPPGGCVYIWSIVVRHSVPSANAIPSQPLKRALVANRRIRKRPIARIPKNDRSAPRPPSHRSANRLAATRSGARFATGCRKRDGCRNRDGSDTGGSVASLRKN
jgi:hypothetical protein